MAPQVLDSASPHPAAWLAIVVALTGCQGGPTIIDVPNSQDAFAVVTHDITTNQWFAQVEGSAAPVFAPDSELEVFVFDAQFALPSGDLALSIGAAEQGFPPPDGAFRLEQDRWEPTEPGDDFFALRYRIPQPPCPEVMPGFLGFIDGSPPVVALLSDEVGVVAFTEAGVATLIQATGDSVLTSTLGTTRDAASPIDDVIYIATENALLRATISRRFADIQDVGAISAVTQLYEATGRIFALTEAKTLLEYNELGFVRSLDLPEVAGANEWRVSIAENETGVWLGFGPAVYRLTATTWTEVARFERPVTALTPFGETLVVFAGDVHRLANGDAEVLIPDAGLDVSKAVEWGMTWVVGLKTPFAENPQPVIYDLAENYACPIAVENPHYPVVAFHRTAPAFAFSGQAFGVYRWNLF